MARRTVGGSSEAEPSGRPVRLERPRGGQPPVRERTPRCDNGPYAMVAQGFAPGLRVQRSFRIGMPDETRRPLRPQRVEIEHGDAPCTLATRESDAAPDGRVVDCGIRVARVQHEEGHQPGSAPTPSQQIPVRSLTEVRADTQLGTGAQPHASGRPMPGLWVDSCGPNDPTSRRVGALGPRDVVVHAALDRSLACGSLPLPEGAAASDDVSHLPCPEWRPAWSPTC